MSNNQQIGVIHEIGDMGLGYQELTEAEKKQIKDGQKKSEEERTKSK